MISQGVVDRNGRRGAAGTVDEDATRSSGELSRRLNSDHSALLRCPKATGMFLKVSRFHTHFQKEISLSGLTPA